MLVEVLCSKYILDNTKNIYIMGDGTVSMDYIYHFDEDFELLKGLDVGGVYIWLQNRSNLRRE